MTEDTSNRRPIASRNVAVIRAFARRLAEWNVTPNQISQSSMVFAGLSGLSFCLSGWLVSPILLVFAAIFIQLRLLANLLDGLVAVEGEMGTRDGAFWNEAPDRVSDTLILAGAGIAISLPSLGLVAAIGALMTAYIRAMSSALVAQEDYSGPMAKQHRMALMTICAFLGAAELAYSGTSFALFFGLSAVAIGSLFTAFKRSRTLIHALSVRR